jgi:hypothetical protein
MRTAEVAKWSVVLAVALAVGSARPAQAQAKAQTATQFYMAYRAAFDKASKIEELFPYMAESNVKQVQATPTEQRAKMFEVVKAMGALTGVKVVKEEHTPDGGAMLTVEALGPDKSKTTGKITIVKEKGAWKVGREAWSS